RRRHGQTHPCSSQRVADRYGAAAHVHLLAIELELFLYGEILRGKGLVDLEAIDALWVETGSFQHRTNRRCRSNAHDLRRDRDRGSRNDTRQRPQAMCTHILAGSYQGGSRAVDDGRAVATRLDSLRTKGGPELTQHL